MAGQLNDLATQSFAAYCVGGVCVLAGDLPRAIAHFDDGLAVLPKAAVHSSQHALLLISVSVAAGLAGDEERVVACHRELAALTEAGGEFIQRICSARWLWALGLAAWRRGDLDRAAGLQQQSLRLRADLNDRMEQPGDRRRAVDLAADRRRPREAHPHQARLHLTSPGRRLGRLPTGRRRRLRGAWTSGIIIQIVQDPGSATGICHLPDLSSRRGSYWGDGGGRTRGSLMPQLAAGIQVRME